MYDTFTELGVKPEILKAVEDMGFEEPTPIQKAAIPTALTGKDLIGQAQTAITVLGDLFYVDIQCPHPFLFWLAAAASSFVFTLLIYSLTVAMGNVGEAIAVIIMVIQVAGAGGTFPIEVLPEVYQMIYKYLPFTYCMNAMRECVGGVYQNDYWMDLSALGVYVLISLLVGLIVAIPLRRLNKVIERSKEKSKVML